MSKTTKYTRWVIVGRCGLYTGQRRTRAAAIAGHVFEARRENEPATSGWPDGINGSSLSSTQRELWEKRRAEGDRCVKATIVVPAAGKGSAA